VISGSGGIHEGSAVRGGLALLGFSSFADIVLIMTNTCNEHLLINRGNEFVLSPHLYAQKIGIIIVGEQISAIGIATVHVRFGETPPKSPKKENYSCSFAGSLWRSWGAQGLSPALGRISMPARTVITQFRKWPPPFPLHRGRYTKSEKWVCFYRLSQNAFYQNIGMWLRLISDLYGSDFAPSRCTLHVTQKHDQVSVST
jgi:hypothetical protein